MADLPILFSAPMIRAILREMEQPGTGKSQTRRALKPQPPSWANFCEQPQMLNVLHQWVPSGLWRWAELDERRERQMREWPLDDDGSHYWLRPPHAVGDRLYVREHWWTEARWDGVAPRDLPRAAPIYPQTDPEPGCVGRLRQGMHMPRWASRITLIVTDVRVQQLQEISEADAQAEGVIEFFRGSDRLNWPAGSADDIVAAASESGIDGPVAMFRDLWDTINAKRGYCWGTNPWVAAYTFRPILGNIDQVQP